VFPYLPVRANRPGGVDVEEILTRVQVDILSGISCGDGSSESGSDQAISVVRLDVEDVLFPVVLRNTITLAES